MCVGLVNEDVFGVYDVLLFLIFNIYKVMEFNNEVLFIDMVGKNVVVFGGGDMVMDCVCILIC